MARKPSARPIALDQKFWTSFAKNHWEKKPIAYKNVGLSLRAITDAEIFDLLVLYANRCRKRKDPEGFKFYIDGLRVGADDVLQLLPVKKDKSLLGYHARMDQLFGDYCLVCDELLQVIGDKKDSLTEFTDELYRHVGFPNRFTEIGLYLGNYRKTPFGVHVDKCGVFSFPVVGKKRFRTWTSEFVAKHPALDRAFKYEKFKKQSLVLEAEAGDMTYWPSSSWHIAESDGSFSATWSLGVWVDRTHVDFFTDVLKGLLMEVLGPEGAEGTTRFDRMPDASDEVTELPHAFARSNEILKNLSAAGLSKTLLEAWTRHISSRGLKSSPQERSFKTH